MLLLLLGLIREHILLSHLICHVLFSRIFFIAIQIHMSATVRPHLQTNEGAIMGTDAYLLQVFSVWVLVFLSSLIAKIKAF